MARGSTEPLVLGIVNKESLRHLARMHRLMTYSILNKYMMHIML